MQLSPKEIYEKIRHLDLDQDIESIPEIQRLIMKFEDAISCVINTPEKLNPTLAYNLQLIISNLIDVLKNKNNNLRKSQITSIMSIIDFLISWETRWLIKLPTGAGKTRLFTEIVTSLSLPTVILVPKINLKWQMGEYFMWENVFNIWENGTVIWDVTKTLKTIREKDIVNPIIIITYQSFVRLKEDKKLFGDFSQMIKVVIRDEAHRSLGDKTQEALNDMHSYNEIDEEALQEQDKDLLETDVLSSNEKLELLFTATPNLLDKSVRDTYEEIFGLRIQDLVEEWVLHMPKFIQLSEAYIDIGDQNFGERILNQFATKFVNEKKEFTYMEIANKYLELKQENSGYLPAVGFCRDIEHAEFMKKYLMERWLRAIRVTSSNARYDVWVDEDEAKRMIEANEIDIVLTVTKVSEWWDVPTLRCALNFAPILSEAKYIQGVGRVLRTFDFEKEREANETNGTLPKSFAYVIEPKFWNISSWGWNGDNWGWDEWWDERDEKSSKNTTKISGITHFIDSWEFDIGYLRDLYGNLDEYGQIITQEEVLEFFKTRTFEEWISLQYKDIGWIEFKGIKIISLANLAGWDNPNKVDLYALSRFKEFISWIFGREIENITQEEVLEFFKTKTFDEWMEFKQQDLFKIEFKQKKIMALVLLSGWDNPNDIYLYNLSGFKEFIAWVFEREIESITQEAVLEFFKTKTFEEWLELTYKDIRGIEFKGKRIIGLAKLAGWSNSNGSSIQTPAWFQEFISWIFEREIENLTQEEVLVFFKTKTFDEWMELKQQDLKEIEFQWKKITGLATLTGWKNPDKTNLNTLPWFQDFMAWVFEKKLDNITQEEVIEFFKTKTFEEWLRVKQQDLKEIEFKWKKIISLATLTGWKNLENVNIGTILWFREFICWIFGKELNINEQVLKFFKTKPFEEWLKFNVLDIKKIEFQGKKIKSLAALSRWNNPNKINLESSTWFQEFMAWVFGKELEIITKAKVLDFFKTKTLEEWRKITSKDILKIEFQWKKITGLAILAEWSNPNNCNLQNLSWFQEFITWVFEKQDLSKK